MYTTDRPGFDNITEAAQNSSSGGDVEPFPFPAPTAIPALHKFGYTFGFSISLIGICANSVVFGVLMRARRQFGSNVNTFIINQSVMDLAACVFVFIFMMFHITEPATLGAKRSEKEEKSAKVRVNIRGWGQSWNRVTGHRVNGSPGQ